LIEEIARIYGYNRLPTRHTPTAIALKPQSETRKPLSQMRRVLLARGYQEAITYSFVDPQLQKLIDPDITPVPVKNPIASDMSVMRTSLWAGLLKTLQHNLNRQQSRVRLFETGLRFVPSADGLRQEPMLAGLISGSRYPESWAEQGESVDFYDLKGDLEAVLAFAGAEVALSVGNHSALHPGQTAVLRTQEGAEVGYIGGLHPQLQGQLDLQQAVYLFEVRLDALLDGALPKFEELSKFPEVRRDLAFIVDQSINAGDVAAAIREAAGDYLRNLRLFDTYQGKGIDPQRKSLGFGLTFRHSSRTLNDDEIAAILSQVIELLNKRYQADLRA
jgi:phenylalanyl-tRNA synthetase beta chain